MAIAKVFLVAPYGSLKFLKSAPRTKKKKTTKDPKIIANSTTNVAKPAKQSRIVAAICLKAFAKLGIIS